MAADDAGTTNEDAIRGKLSAIVREVESLVRASCLFRSLAIGAANGIKEQAEQHKALAKTIGSQEVRDVVHDGPEKGQVAAVATRIEHEAAAQVKFADWLRRLAGEKGNPPTPTPK